LHVADKRMIDVENHAGCVNYSCEVCICEYQVKITQYVEITVDP